MVYFIVGSVPVAFPPAGNLHYLISETERQQLQPAEAASEEAAMGNTACGGGDGPTEFTTHTIYVKTGDKKGAGTDGNVSVQRLDLYRSPFYVCQE